MVASKFSLPKANCPDCGRAARYVGTEISATNKKEDLTLSSAKNMDFHCIKRREDERRLIVHSIDVLGLSER
jgi:hypothetical protein